MTTSGADPDVDPHQSTCAYKAGGPGPMHDWAEVATDAALKHLHLVLPAMPRGIHATSSVRRGAHHEATNRSRCLRYPPVVP